MLTAILFAVVVLLTLALAFQLYTARDRKYDADDVFCECWEETTPEDVRFELACVMIENGWKYHEIESHLPIVTALVLGVPLPDANPNGG